MDLKLTLVWKFKEIREIERSVVASEKHPLLNAGVNIAKKWNCSIIYG